MRSVLLALALPLLLLGAKHGGATKVEPAPAAAPEAPVTAMTQEVMSTLDMHGTVTLEDAGAAPRTVLLFAPRPGAVATTEVTQRMTMVMLVNRTAMPMPPSATTTITRTTVGQPDTSGNIRVHNQILMADAGQAETGASAAVEAARGLTTEIIVSPAGKFVGVEVSSGGDPTMSKMVEELAKMYLQNIATLPAAAVGIGAHWRTDFDITVAGMTLLAETTTTLRAVHGQELELDVATSIQQGTTGFVFPGLPPGMHIDITKLNGSGTGTLTVDLGTLVSLQNQKFTRDLEMSMSMPRPSSATPQDGGAPATSRRILTSMHMDQEMTSRLVE